MTAQELFDAMKRSTGRRGVTADLSTYDPDTNPTVGDQMPDYGSFMPDGQIWDLVKFLKTTAVDTSTLYDSVATGVYPTGSMAFSNIGLDGDAANGDAIFAANCVACHGANGEGLIGPSFCDSNWIHGGAIEDLVRIINIGVPAKGMIPWDKTLTPEQILQVASYILTFEGTNPPNQKVSRQILRHLPL